MSTGEADLAPVVTSVTPYHDDDLDMKIRGEVVDFLRDLAYKVEGARLSPKADREVSEFYLRWSFMNEMFSQKHPTSSTEETGSEETSGGGTSFTDDAELLKFMSLGWFVYKNLLDPQ